MRVVKDLEARVEVKKGARIIRLKIESRGTNEDQ